MDLNQFKGETTMLLSRILFSWVVLMILGIAYPWLNVFAQDLGVEPYRELFEPGCENPAGESIKINSDKVIEVRYQKRDVDGVVVDGFDTETFTVWEYVENIDLPQGLKVSDGPNHWVAEVEPAKFLALRTYKALIYSFSPCPTKFWNYPRFINTPYSKKPGT